MVFLKVFVRSFWAKTVTKLAHIEFCQDKQKIDALNVFYFCMKLQQPKGLQLTESIFQGTILY